MHLPGHTCFRSPWLKGFTGRRVYVSPILRPSTEELSRRPLGDPVIRGNASPSWAVAGARTTDRVMVPSGADGVPFADIPGPSFPVWSTPPASALFWGRGVPASMLTMGPLIVARWGTWWKCRPGVVTGCMIVEMSLSIAAS